MTRPQRAALAALLGVALALRIATVVSLEGSPFFYEPIVDAGAYDAWATRIATESFWGTSAFYQDPLYPYGLGIFYAVFGRDLLWARLVQCLLGTLGLWMLFEGVRRLLGFRTAIAALAIGAFYKTFVFYDGALLKDFLGVMAVEAAILLLSLESRWKWAALGAALGLGTLVRGNMLLLAAAAAAFLLLRRERRAAAWVLAGAAACIAPVTVRNAVVAKDFVLTTAQLGPNLYTGNNPENLSGRYRPPRFLVAGATEFEEKGFREEAEKLNRRSMKASEIDAYWRGRAVDWILGNPGAFLAVTGKRLLMLLNAFEIPDDHDPAFLARFSLPLRLPLLTFGLLVFPLAAAGIYLSWPDRAKFGLLYVLPAAYAFSIVFFFVFARYRMPVVPFLIVFAAHALVRGAQLVSWRMRAMPKTAAAVFAAALLVNVPLPESAGGHRDFRTAHANLALYYVRHPAEGDPLPEFKAAADLDPDRLRDPAFVWQYAEACRRAYQDVRAFELYETAARLAPGDPEPPYRLGRICFEKELFERAAEQFLEAARRDPKYEAAWIDLAESQVRLKRPDRAIDALTAGARQRPDVWGIPLRLAQICEGLSLWPQARSAAEDALRLAPKNAEAQRIRDLALRKLR